MDEDERQERLKRILTLSTRAAVRLAYESAIFVVEDVEKHRAERTSMAFALGYQTALLNVKQELVKLHSEFAE